MTGATQYLWQPGPLLQQRRTVETLEGIRVALPKQARVEVADELYLADANILLTRLRGLNDKDRCAMLVGHNPGIEDLASMLTGEWTTMPTSALALIELTGTWRDADASSGVLRTSGRPPAE